MHKAFRKYDKAAVKTVEIPISELNKIFSEAGSDLKCLCRYEEQSDFVKMSSKSEVNIPHTTIAGNILGIHILDWQWNANGYSVIITYKT